MIVYGAVGQSARLILACQFLDDDAQPATPTGPQIRVLGGSPVAVLAGPIVPIETAGLTGFMVAELDVSNPLTWPAGQYVIRWDGSTSGKATSTVDYLQLSPSPAFAGGAAIGTSYTTEERIRKVAEILKDTTSLTTPEVALDAQRGADYINMRLAGVYAVPFASPFDPGIVLLNDWKSAELLLDRFYSENGNAAAFGEVLGKWVDDALDRLIDGSSQLATVDPVGGPGTTRSSTLDKTHTFCLPVPRRTPGAYQSSRGRRGC